MAQRLGRDAVLIEISEKYSVMARTRIEADAMAPEAGARHVAKALGKDKPFEVGTLFAPQAEAAE